MTSILFVNPHKLIALAAEELKQEKALQPPEWSKFVKTGHHKERLPDAEDWWYVRSAAILRSVAKLGPIGTQKLRTKYGGKKNRRHKPGHRYVASGSIIRTILKQLEGAQLIIQTQKGAHKGRILTPKGVSLLDRLARGIEKGAQNGAQ